MVSGAVSRRALERRIQNAKVVREWKRRAANRRCSIAKLAKCLGLTRAKTLGLVNQRPKKLAILREKIKVIRAVSLRVRRPVRRRDTAAKVASDLGVSRISVRAVQRLRRPYRAKGEAARGAAL